MARHVGRPGGRREGGEGAPRLMTGGTDLVRGDPEEVVHVEVAEVLRVHEGGFHGSA